MTNDERWQLALEAHKAEHDAMHERGLGRIGVWPLARRSGVGQFRINTSRAVVTPTDYGGTRKVAPVIATSRSMHSFMQRRGLRGLGQSDEDAKLYAKIIAGVIIGAGALFLISRSGIA